MAQYKTLQHGEIPIFLQNAELFQILNIDEPIVIPLIYYKEDDKINSLDDLLLYLKTIDFCCLDNKYISLDIYTYIFHNRCQIIENAKLMPFIDKNIEFKYLAELGGKSDSNSENDKINICIKNDYFNCFKILLDSFYPWDEATIILSVKYNKINYLIYLYEFYNNYRIWGGDHKTFPWTHCTINTAIKNGNLECLKYAIENKCVDKDGINYSFCNLAIICEQYDCLNYLLENGFVWNSIEFVFLEKKQYGITIKYEGSDITTNKEYYKYINKHLILQIMINDIIFGRVDYGLPPLLLNDIANRIIANKIKIDEIIEKIIDDLWEIYGAKTLKNMPIGWISECLYNITEELIY